MRPTEIREREDTAPPAVGGSGHHTGGHQWRRIRDVIASRTVADGARPVSIEIGAPQVAAETQGEAANTKQIGGARFELLDPADLAFPAPATGTGQRPADPEHTPQSLVAARTLHGADGPYSIIIGRPYPSEDGRYALCRFHISEHRPAVASGVDGIQALLTAFRMIAGLRDLPADWPVSRLA